MAGLGRILSGRSGRARLAAIASAALALASAAWIGAPLHWVIDLVGNLSAHVLPIVALAAIWWTLRRYRAATVVGWASVCVLVWPLATGRAPRAGSDAPAIRVLVYNPLTLTRPAEAEIHIVRDSDTDVVALVEPPTQVIRAIQPGGELRRAYPHMVFRAWGSDPIISTNQALLSRWPLTRPDGRPLDEPFNGIIEAVADTPHGRIGLVVLQPRSPRTEERWRQGLQEADRAAAAARRLAEAGLPVIVMGDLNSTPSGLLSRRLCSRAGLRRCKPWLEPAGTFPADRPWPLRVAIDDVLVSRGVRVSSWETLAPAGSDHRPVLAGLTLPPAAPTQR